MKIRDGALLLTYLLGTYLMVQAQTQTGLSRQYTMDDGLPEAAVNDVLKDSYGFLWLATYDGLTRFDGYKFITYHHRPGSKNAPTHNRINSLWEDRRGRLWIAHAKGVDIFDLRTETFQFLGPDSVSADVGIARLRERRDGKLWLCGSGIFIADPETLTLTKMPGMPPGDYLDIAEMSDGSVWIAGEHSVIHLDQKTGNTSIYKPDAKNHFGSASFVIHIDEKERVWIGSNGLFRFEPETESFTGFMTSNHVRGIEGTSGGKLLVGHGHGLFLFDPNTGNYDTISKGWSNSVLLDEQGIIWHASLSGLNKINPKMKQFTIEKAFGNIFTIEKDGNDLIWMATSKGQFTFSSAFTEILDFSKGLESGPLSFMGSDNSGSIFFTRSPNKFLKYDFKTSSISSIRTMPIKDEFVISLFVDSFGQAWMGGWQGVKKYNPASGIVDTLPALARSTVLCFLEDAYKNLWIGTNRGLIRYNLITNNSLLITNDPTDNTSLSDNAVFHIMIDENENIWIGTDRGLNQLVRGTENIKPQFKRWTTHNSDLPDDNVFCLVDNKDGTLWMACGNIISHFDPKQNLFRNYGPTAYRTDGAAGTPFRNAQYVGGKGVRTSDGKIIFALYGGGLVIFHPDSLIDNLVVPPIVITDFMTGNQSVPIAKSEGDTIDWDTPLFKGISHAKGIKLPYDKNDFFLEFSALNFINPESNQYKYKLEPYENEWIETPAKNRVARYTNIDPGRYVFRVIGSNNDGIWNEQGASLMIIIAPPWWKTWWAYSVYFLLSVAIFASWRRYEQRRVKLKHRADQLTELDALKTKFFANISHEFRTPIALILGPLTDLYNETSVERPKAILNVVIRNAQRLLRLINQLLDLSKIEDGQMRLHASRTDLVEFLRDIAGSYESIASDKKIKYILYPEQQELFTYIDQDKIEKVVHNLLSNAFKFTNSGGEVIINLKNDKDWAWISVKDTGIGIPADEINKVFDRFYQVDSSQTRRYEGTGLGMALAKELVERHKGKISVQSVEGKGSTFTVKLPLGKNYLGKDEISETTTQRDSETPADVSGPGKNYIFPVSEFPKKEGVLLIVEDNDDMRHYISKTLSGHYQILEAKNGKLGITIARESTPDLIISDIMMPEMDGYQFCEKIKTDEITSHIPVILLTARADHESKIAGLETGADDYLLKPFNTGELKLIIQKRIEIRRELRKRFSREIVLRPKDVVINSYDEKFLLKVLAIIEEHMADENFSIEQLSIEAGFSNMHFYRKIKALSGQSPSQFLRIIRLKRAAKLLAYNSDNVTQIAYSVGFSSLSYFNKCFKEQFGVPPGQYAAQSREASTPN